MAEYGWEWRDVTWECHVPFDGAQVGNLPCVFKVSVEEDRGSCDGNGDQFFSCMDISTRESTQARIHHRQKLFSRLLVKWVDAWIQDASQDGGVLGSREVQQSAGGESTADFLTDGMAPASPVRPPGFSSISHSGNFVVLAVAPFPVGLDVEKKSPPERYPHITGRLFPKEWSEALQALKGDHEEQAALFSRYWTAMESLYKLKGKGSLLAFLRDCLSKEKEWEQATTHKVLGYHFPVDGAYTGCVTFQQEAPDIRFYELLPAHLLLSG